MRRALAGVGWLVAWFMGDFGGSAGQRRGSGADLRLQVVLFADLVGELELGFEVVDMRLGVPQDALEQVARHVVAGLLALGDALFQGRLRGALRAQVGAQRLEQRLPDRQLAYLVSISFPSAVTRSRYTLPACAISASLRSPSNCSLDQRQSAPSGACRSGDATTGDAAATRTAEDDRSCIRSSLDTGTAAGIGAVRAASCRGTGKDFVRVLMAGTASGRDAGLELKFVETRASAGGRADDVTV